MKLAYEERVELLLKKQIIDDKDEVFFPEKGGDYEELSIFYQEYLEASSFGFSKPIFFFGAEESLNAWAWKHNGLDVICINQYSLAFIHNILDEHENFIVQHLKTNKINTHYDNGLPATTIMKQMIEMFLFYHELGHLIQEQEPVLTSTFVEEQYENEEFDIMDHISEYDSDLFASVRLATHILKVYERQAGLSTINAKKRFLEDSGIIAIASYIVYRLHLFPDYGNFYTKESTHPHIIFRIITLTIHLTKAIIDNSEITLTRQRIIHESLSLVEEFTKVLPRLSSVNSFIEMGKSNFDQILHYTHELNEIVISSDSTAHVKSQKKIKND